MYGGFDLLSHSVMLAEKAQNYWWDKSSFTWFFRGQSSNKSCQCKRSRLSLFILDNKKWRIFNLKNDNGKLWAEVIIVSFLDAIATVDVLTATNTDVKLVDTRTVQFARLKSSSCFERINKLNGHYSYWQFLPLVCPLKYHVTLLLSHQL